MADKKRWSKKSDGDTKPKKNGDGKFLEFEDRSVKLFERQLQGSDSEDDGAGESVEPISTEQFVQLNPSRGMTLQQALELCPPGSTIELLPGTFNVEREIVINHPVKIRGLGGLDYRCKVVFTSQNARFSINSPDVVFMGFYIRQTGLQTSESCCVRCEKHDLTLNKVKLRSTGHGIILCGEQARIRGTEVLAESIVGAALFLLGVQTPSTLTSCIFQKCTTGVHSINSELDIVGSEFRECKYGIVSEASAGKAESNLFLSCGCGVQLLFTRLVVTGNRFTRCFGGVICNASGSLVEKNDIVDSADVGILLQAPENRATQRRRKRGLFSRKPKGGSTPEEPVANNILSDTNIPVARACNNNISNGRGSGLFIVGKGHFCIVEDNTITGTSNDGVTIAGEAEPEVLRNTITQCGPVGLRLLEQARGRYEENKITDCRYPVWVESTSSITTDDMVAGNFVFSRSGARIVAGAPASRGLGGKLQGIFKKKEKDKGADKKDPSPADRPEQHIHIQSVDDTGADEYYDDDRPDDSIDL